MSDGQKNAVFVFFFVVLSAGLWRGDVFSGSMQYVSIKLLSMIMITGALAALFAGILWVANYLKRLATTHRHRR